MRFTKIFVLHLTVIMVMMLVSCASFNKSHTTNFRQQQNMIHQGKLDQVIQKVETKAKKGGRDSVIHSLQAGYYYLFAQDYEKSRELFKLAENKIQDFEERGKVNARGVAAGAKAAAASDMELPYKGEMFEKVMVNTFLAMNYLFTGDMEAANVEIRRAELRQNEAEEKHQKELKKIDQQKKKKKLDDRSLNSIFDNYKVLDEYSAKVVNSFQNSFTYYLSGLVYELNNKPDDAYNDYYKSFGLYKNKYTLGKLIQLSNATNRQEELENWQNMYQELFNEKCLPDADKNNAELVVIYFCGNVPRKNQVKFSLWLPKKSFNVAFPFYDKSFFHSGADCLSVKLNGETIGDTAVVLDFVPVVVKALKEKLPGIVVRQIIRLITKNSVEKQASKKAGLFGKYAAKILNSVTERADLRGWYELPANIQVFRTPVKPGQSAICLEENCNDVKYTIKDINLDLPPNGTALVLVHQLASKRSTHTIIVNGKNNAENLNSKNKTETKNKHKTKDKKQG